MTSKILPFPVFNELPENIYINISNIINSSYDKNKFNKKSKNLFFKLLNPCFESNYKKKFFNIFIQSLKYHISKAKIIRDTLNNIICIHFLINSLDVINYNNIIHDWLDYHIKIIINDINNNSYIKTDEIFLDEINLLKEFNEKVSIIEINELITKFILYITIDELDIIEINKDKYYDVCYYLFNNTDNNDNKYLSFINKCKEFIILDNIKSETTQIFYDNFIKNIYNNNLS